MHFDLTEHFAYCIGKGKVHAQCKICNSEETCRKFCSQLLAIFQRIHYIASKEQIVFNYLPYLERMLNISKVAPKYFKQEVALNLYQFFFNNHKAFIQAATNYEFMQILLCDQPTQSIIFDVLGILSELTINDLSTELFDNLVKIDIAKLIIEQFMDKSQDIQMQAFTNLRNLYVL